MFGEMDIIESIDFMIHKMLGLICHQDPSIILYVQGHSMPLCPRCTGMHIGFFLGIVSIWLFRDSVWQRLARINTIMVFIPVSIMGMEWFLSNCNLISSNTTSRLLTGFLGGLGICVFLIIYQNRHSLQITAILNKKIVLLISPGLLILILALSIQYQNYWFYLNLFLVYIVLFNLLVIGTTIILRIRLMIRNFKYSMP